MRSPSLALVAVASLIHPVAMADTLSVGPDGTGADFDNLAEAVAAAQPGDLVVVAAGEYNQLGSAVIDKPLTVLGAGSGETRITALPTFPFQVPLPLVVSGLESGEEVRVFGLELRSSADLGSAASGFAIQDCAGPVVLADILCAGAAAFFPGGSMASVTGSDQVTLDGCQLIVGPSVEPAPWQALAIVDSDVSINGCTLVGGGANLGFGSATAADGASGLTVDSSTARIARSTVSGGSGTQGGPFGSPQTAAAGGTAVVATSSQVFLRGGPDNALQGGQGGTGNAAGQPLSGPGGSALALDASSQATSALDVVATAGLDGDGTSNTAVITGSGNFAPLAWELATLASEAKLVAPGGIATLGQSGEPSSVFVSWFALGQGPSLDLSAFLGPFVLPVGPLTLLATTSLDGAGAGQLSVPVPPNPMLVGATVFFQGLAAGPGSTLSLSSVTFLGVR